MPGMIQNAIAEVSDEELMMRLAYGGSRETSDSIFAEIFARYHQRVIAWCFRVTKDYDYSNDLAQEVFIKAFRHSASFRGDARLSTWLFSIARNHCLSAIRRRNEETVPLEATVLNFIADERAVFGDQTTERTELCARLLRLMTRALEPLEVRVMTLHYAHEVPLAVITRQLSLTNPSGAKAYIVNARRKLNGIARRRGWDNALTATTSDWSARAAA